MSEHAPLNPERSEAYKQSVKNEHVTNQTERELTNSEREHGSNEQVQRLQKHVEAQAASKNEQAHIEKEHNAQHPVLIRKDIKEIQFNRAMTRVRKKLSVPSRAFSRIVHVSAIDKSSEFIGKTVARPSGMLAGSLVAFIGTSILLWVTKYNGYEYNYLVVVILFVGGLIIGAAGEGLWRLLRKK